MTLGGVMNRFRGTGLVAVLAVCVAGSELAAQEQTFYTNIDGTIVDGGVFGEFDGVPDDWDWTFDDSGYEGAITLSTESPINSMEHRVVWEYDLRTLTIEPPVSATLHFTIRGATVFPIEDAVVHIYTYPANLDEDPEDFGAEPAVFQGSVTVPPFQPATDYELDVSDAVNDVLGNPLEAVAFRFQINPDTPHDRNQAFIDAADDDPSTKPFLVISEGPGLPGDGDGDGDVDLDDYVMFAACIEGPDVPVGAECEIFDLDGDGDVDVDDFAVFQQSFTGSLD
jgi:hypothetical protein